MPRLLADLTPLRVSPPFRRLWWGLTLAAVGSQITVVAVGLQVYAITGSTLAVGVLGMCALVPLVLLGLYGGALVDAHDRRTVAIASAGALWLFSILIAAQAWLGLSNVLLLYALVAGQSAAFAINNPARSAIVPRLIEPRHLPAANALTSVAANTAMTVGPLLGAALVATAGFPIAYSVDVVTFAAALWALFRLPAIPPEPGTAPRTAGLASVLEGLRYLGTRPNVRMTFLIDMAAMVLAQPRVLFPAVGVLYLGGGETMTGALTAAVAAGALLAAVLSGPLARVRFQGRAIAWSVATWGAAVACFGLVLLVVGPTTPTTTVWWAAGIAAVFLAVAGAADTVSAVFRQTILQAATPDAMRGRLQGVFIVVVAGGPRLGELVGGAEATWFTEGWAAVLGGVTCVLAVIALMAWHRGFLSYDARDPQP